LLYFNNLYKIKYPKETGTEALLFVRVSITSDECINGFIKSIKYNKINIILEY